MASILKVDDLRGNTAAGNITITSEGGSATMQLQQGLTKWWITLQLETSQITHDSFNISSTSDDATGTATVTFTNNMNNDDYCATMGQSDGGGFNDLRSLNHEETQAYSTSQFGFYAVSGTSLNDYIRCWVAGIGDLA